MVGGNPPEGVGAWAGAGGDGFRVLIAEKSRCMTLMFVKVVTKAQMTMDRSNVGGVKLDQDHNPSCAKSVT